jgi:proteic killer suppression protein
MIQGYKCRDTELLKRVGESRRFKAIERVALRKLDMLDAAVNLDALKVPPGNKLESLQGDRKGQYSIRINQQWRVCFVWHEGCAYDVEIVDYH